MIPIECHQVEVHLFRRRGRRTEYLLLRRSPHRSLAGVWQPVTGGIERGEAAYEAAAREVLEETGLTPLRLWSLEHIAVFYEPAADAVRAVPTFVAEVAWTDPVQLSDEHDRYVFAAPARARTLVLWESQRAAMDAVRREVFDSPVHAAAREVTARLRPKRSRAPIAVRPKRAARPPKPSPARSQRARSRRRG